MSQLAPEPRYPFVHIDVTAEQSDEASSLLFDLGAQGVEERDETTLIKGEPGRVTLVASFASRDAADEALVALADEDASWNARLHEVVGDAWRDEWKKYFHPFPICEGLVVRPPWEPYAAAPGETVLELEPGRAFGTGLHETTSLVAQALQAHAGELAGARILDVGCGSGVLSLVALKLGASHARAIDVDADSIDVTRENAARNALAASVLADTTDITAVADRFPIVVANIEARVLIPLSGAIAARVSPGGLLVLSGILAPQRDDVCAAYAAFELLGTPAKGEWIAIVLRARGAAA